MIRPKRNLENLYRFPLSEETRQDKVRLEMNENICPLNEAELDDIRALLHPNFFNCYPEYHVLYEQLAQLLDVSADSLLLCNGSDSASRLLFETFISEGDHVLVTRPTFAMHRVYAEVVGAEIEEVEYSSDFSLDIQSFCERITSATKLCILVNPNNPTGHLLSLSSLETIAKHCEERDVIVMIDEAYIDFSGQSFASLAPSYENVIVTRTFSKAFGLAALRLGYLVSNPRFAKLLRRTQPIFDVNNFAIECAKYLLARPEILQRHHQSLTEGLRMLETELGDAGYQIHVGAGNFLLIRSNSEPLAVQEALAQRNILISAGFSLEFLSPYIRISLCPPEQMRLFLDAFLEIDSASAQPEHANSADA